MKSKPTSEEIKNNRAGRFQNETFFYPYSPLTQGRARNQADKQVPRENLPRVRAKATTCAVEDPIIADNEQSPKVPGCD